MTVTVLFWNKDPVDLGWDRQSRLISVRFIEKLFEIPYGGLQKMFEKWKTEGYPDTYRCRLESLTGNYDQENEVYLKEDGAGGGTLALFLPCGLPATLNGVRCLFWFTLEIAL